MNEYDVFVSVGEVFAEHQETFVHAVEERLRSEGLIPHTVGRNTFGADAPLKTITELMRTCTGVVVIALERCYIVSGSERRGGDNETRLADVKLATPWNQVEAAMAYSRGLPLMVIVEVGVKNEGLLARGYDWYVQVVKPEPAALNSSEFNGVLASWKQKVVKGSVEGAVDRHLDLDKMSFFDLIRSLKTSHLWSVLSALSAIVAGAFVLGSKLAGAK